MIINLIIQFFRFSDIRFWMGQIEINRFFWRKKWWYPWNNQISNSQWFVNQRFDFLFLDFADSYFLFFFYYFTEAI